MKVALIGMLALACLTAHAQQQSDWVLLTSTDTTKWEGRVGSREFSKTRGGKEIVVAAGRVINKKTTTIEFEKWYVSVEDCEAQQGKLVTLDMSGKYKYETDFVSKGGSVASMLAEMLCYAVEQRSSKSL